MIIGSIIVPAHNEAAVIVRTLEPLAPLIALGVELVVATNGCTDDTAARARSIPGVVVLEVPIASKSDALNAADTVATTFPRLYLDADIGIRPEAVVAVLDRLRVGDVMAARPAFQYNTSGAGLLVKAYYRARDRISGMREHLWGAGAYAVSEEGHTLLGRFPALIADDLYVDQMFSREQVAIVETSPVQVRCPRTAKVLLRTLARVQSGKREVAQTKPIDPVGGFWPLLHGVSGPASLFDSGVFAGFAVASRLLALSGAATWHRDDTNRVDAVTDRASVAQEAVPRGDISAQIDHVVLTRFNVPSQGVESLIRARDGWLRGRVRLFETYTVPSMECQQLNYTWLIYFDPESPTWFKEWLQPFAERGLFVPLFRESVSRDDLISDIRRHVERRGDVLITTNLDNDDGVAADFLERIQDAAPQTPRAAVYLNDGLILAPGGLYRRRDNLNAFCSVRESWDNPMTCWVDWHNLLSERMPALHLDGPPAWLQVVHGTNVSNRAQGRLTAPDPFRPRFGRLLDDVVAPTRSAILRDALLDRPLRFLRESGRAAIKKAIFGVAGKDGLDRLKTIRSSWRMA